VSKDDQVLVRLVTCSCPDIDSSFLSSFAINILVSTMEEDEANEEDEEEISDGSDGTSEAGALDEFVDQFVTDPQLSSIVRQSCEGQFSKKWMSTLEEAIQALLADP